MNAGKRISMLWTGSMACFFELFKSASYPRIAARPHIYKGCLLLMLSAFSHTPAALGNECWMTRNGSSWCGTHSCGSGSMSNTFGILPPEFTHSALVGLNSVTQNYFQLVASGVSSIGCSLDNCSAEPDNIFYNNYYTPPLPDSYYRFISCEYTCPPSNPPEKRGWYIGSLNATRVVDYLCVDEDSYKIKLSNANPPASGDLAEVEPGKSTNTLRAKVYDKNNQSVPNVDVRLEVTVEPSSGGHGHGNNRPNGAVGPAEGSTGPDGSELAFTFSAPAPAGDHKIIATCTGGRTCKQEGPDKIWVGIKNLQSLQPDTSYVLIASNADQNHPANHYVTTGTQGKVQGLAMAYHKRFPTDPLLHLNDASLVRGGVFDLAANWLSQPRGHGTHRRGTDVDVRANEFYHDPNESIPTSNYVDLMNLIAPEHGCDAQIHSGATPNEHFHLYCR